MWTPVLYKVQLIQYMYNFLCGRGLFRCTQKSGNCGKSFSNSYIIVKHYTKYRILYTHSHISQSYIQYFTVTEGSDCQSQTFLDKVRHQDLRSLLVLNQNIMRGGDLVSIKAVQQGNADHSRCEEDKKVESVSDFLYCTCFLWYDFEGYMSNHVSVKTRHV